MDIQSKELAARIAHVDNVVFDVGNVLFRFDTDHIRQKFLSPEYRDVLGDAMFVEDHEWSWAQFDMGLVTEEEVAENIARHAGLPHLSGEVLCAVQHFHEDREPLPLAYELPAVKAAGKKLYALTNYGGAGFDRAYAKFDFFQHFDGIVVSGKEKIWKPMPEIYRLLTDRYGLDPARTLFIDDNPNNIAAAQALGWQTWHYTDAIK